MNDFIKNLPAPARLQYLQENAVNILEGETYMRPLSQEEMDIRREQLTDNYIQLSTIEERQKESNAAFKQLMDPLKKSNAVMLMELKTKQQEVMGTVYEMPNYESGMMEVYDHEGEMISSRRLKPEEKRQQRLSFVKPAVNE